MPLLGSKNVTAKSRDRVASNMLFMQWMLICAVGCRPDFKLWCLKSANSCSGCTLYHTNIIDAIRQRLCATPTCELQTSTLPMPLHFITFSASYKRAKTRQMATPSDQWRPLNDIMDMRNSEHMFVLHLKDMQIKSNFSQVSRRRITGRALVSTSTRGK